MKIRKPSEESYLVDFDKDLQKFEVSTEQRTVPVIKEEGS